ncbi:MAG: ATP-binding protein [Planctomycetota bacterium]|jgi:chromosomal replication initiator protein|nr:ATP-binding protein [Planctomycetota bacterium]
MTYTAEPTVALAWQTLWQQALDVLRGELSAASYNTAFGNVKALALTDDCLQIGAANVIVKTHIESNHWDLLTATVKQFFGAAATVKIVVAPDLYREHRRKIATAEIPAPVEKAPPLFVHSKQTFANFILGAGNRFAFAAAQEIIDKPAQFSPLCFFGEQGLGKTHLLHAICHAVSVAKPAAKIICQSAEHFVRAFARATVEKRAVAFRERLENCDLLAIDDFHTLGDGNKLASQKELMQIIEQLHQRGAPVVLTSLISPAEVENLHRPLVLRLRQGLMARLEPLDETARRALLVAKAGALTLTPAIVDYLGAALTGDAREIEGVLNRLRLLAGMTGQPLTLAQAQEATSAVPAKPSRLPMQEVWEAAAAAYGVSVADILSRKRQQAVAAARRAAAHAARAVTGGSLAEIGAALGKRSHATVLALLKTPPFTPDAVLSKQKFAALLNRLGNPVKCEDFCRTESGIFN